ncbi:Utp14-domain-containing protein [Mycena albidolilacea]|uniref:Utp14-domain-containing protein n=1 Tax=Mycena albidolilacea TaxID=1033008 RepID=A0AAD7ACU2_9AGAR|nr:Utp14-domain-containing protein [Mycena albidolilacea]
MARSSRPSTSKPKGPDARAKANAAGYLKRHSTKTATPRVEDVYEILENEGGRRGSKGKGKKSRRETTDLEYDYGEDGADGQDHDPEEDERTEPRLFGEGDKIDSEDDEEIDSDAAFEDIDGNADGFAGVFGRKKSKAPAKKKKAAVRFADVDLNEDEDIDMRGAGSEDEEEEDIDSDTFIDILDVLDGKGEVYNEDSDEEQGPPPKKLPIPLRDPVAASRPDLNDDDSEEDQEIDSGDEDADSGDEEEEDIAPDDEEEIDTSPEALTALHTFISGLPSDAPPPPSAKRKAPTDADASAPRKKRAVPALKERTQAGAEGEFQVGSSTGAQKLSLADLLAPLAAAPAALRAVEKTLAAGPAEERPKTKTGKKAKLVGGGALAAPLPLRTQARVDREAAYEATKEEVEKWAPSMKRIREAEHLNFPLQAPKQATGRVSNAELAAKFKPTTELETAVSRLLATANLTQDADIQRTENQLLTAKLSPEEVARRRNELRQMRELAFRGEVKARRVAKIKSKVYRKIARGRKERAGADGEDEDGDGEDDAMRREVDRARERAGMRIKRNAKWNRARVEGEEEEEEFEGVNGRREMEIELERKERLTRLIRGEKDGASSESDDDDSENEDGDDGVKRSAFNELQSLAKEGDNESPAKQKGVFGMKFMQDAMQRRNVEANKMADDFVAEMGLRVGEGSDEEDADVGPSGVITQRTGGRVVLRPGTEATTSKKIPSSAVPSSTVAPAQSLSPAPTPSEPARPRPLLSSTAPVAEENPWLVQPASTSGPKAPRAKNDILVSKDSKAMDKARHKLAKNEKKLDQTAVAVARDDEVVEIQMDKILGAEEPRKQKADPSSQSRTRAGEDDDSDGANSEVDAQEQALQLKKKGKGKASVQAFEQRDLVALAFAGDNVVRDFEAAKQREIASDAPREVDTTLPGWGSWGGPSIRKNKPKPQFIKKMPGIAPTDRADHGKANIIISEKRDKKLAKYQVKDLPYPYTSRAQFERSMEAPLGSEWNTRVAFQKGTLPRVVKKMGMVIEPLQKQ